ncbi:MAG: hypothetical protein A3K03_10155 [Bdellovibrionales bacterium RIFOXYD1_FULL_44_7]|nr:MAG: hypothetical protein A3K03_10155 [Bdellovibrionales bacterium RIFOXYD1_FULL_44_7]
MVCRLPGFRVLFLSSLLLLNVVLTSFAWANDYVLFEKAGGQIRPVKNYTQLVSIIRPNDVIIFSNGESITVGAEIGRGNTTKVFAIVGKPGQALRIPLSTGTLKHSGQKIPRFLNDFILGYENLARKDVPTVKLIRARPNEFVIVQRMNEHVTFHDFIEKRYKWSSALEKEMLEDIEKFARKTAVFRNIGDLHPEQLAYDLKEKRWILFDWTHPHRLWGGGSSQLLHYHSRTTSGKIPMEPTRLPNGCKSRNATRESNTI